MNSPQPQAERSLSRANLLRWCLSAIVVGALCWFVKQTPHAPTAPAPVASVLEVPRTQLELRSARLYQLGASNAFSGWMVEFYPDGLLRSRSAVTNGRLHGLSQGWHTNGQLQVTEHFKEGMSHGLRTKWSANGGKLSEANLVEGKFHGAFRKWHENGVLSEHVEFVDSQPDGVSIAYFPSGSMKRRAVLQNGRLVEQKSWQDGQFKE